MKVKGAVVVTHSLTLMSMLALAWAGVSHFKVLQQSSVCNGRGAPLSGELSCTPTGLVVWPVTSRGT